MHTQKLSAHYLWFSVLVVNSVAWSLTVTVKLDVFAVFGGFIFFVQGCYKSEFLAPQSIIRPYEPNVSCDPKKFQLGCMVLIFFFLFVFLLLLVFSCLFLFRQLLLMNQQIDKYIIKLNPFFSLSHNRAW